MFNTSIIIAKFASLVGFKETTVIPLDVSLTTSDSGLIYNTVHPQLTPKNIKAYTPNEELDEADAQTRLENFLKDLRNGVITDLVNRFMTEKQMRGTGSELFRSRPLFLGNGSRNNLSPKQSYFVGWQIGLSNDVNILTKIRRVSFHGTEADTITLKLINSNTGEIDGVELNYTTPNQTQWFDVDFQLKAYDPENNIQGGAWFIGYDSSLYVGQAVNKNTNWGNFCRGCGQTYEQTTVGLFNKNSMSLTPVQFANDKDYDYDNVLATTDNFGLNLDVWAGCDYTQFLVDNASTFAIALQLGVSVKLLQYFLNNPDQKVTRQDANIGAKNKQIEMDLLGDAEKVNIGLINEYKQAFEAIQVDTQGLSPNCFKRDDRGKLRTMYR